MGRRVHYSPSRAALSGDRALEAIESSGSIAVDIKGARANPGFEFRVDIDTHVGVCDQEIKDSEAETQRTVRPIGAQLETLADVTAELMIGLYIES